MSAGRPNFRAARGAHRARSHEAAHADDAAPAASPVPVHPLIPAGPPELIESDADLANLLDRLRSAGTFAYDSEFIGEETYLPLLCLVQVAWPGGVALIDPLAPLDLAPFWQLLTDASVAKIVHAGEQDIEPVHRLAGQPARNVFDTQLAGGMAGLPYPLSLIKLVEHACGVRLNKAHTLTQWDRRPLSTSQLRYAADDVRYLIAVHAFLVDRLETLGHRAWATQECDALCDPGRYALDVVSQSNRIRGSSGLSPRNLAVLRALVGWRDGAARQADIPPRSFLKDELLLDLARSPAREVTKLAGVRGLPRPVEQMFGQQIVDLTQAALAMPASDLPPAPDREPTPLERFRGDGAWALMQTLATGRGVDPALVASRAGMAEFSRRIEAGKSVEELPVMTGWRREAVGQTLVDMIRNNAAIRVLWKDGVAASNI